MAQQALPATRSDLLEAVAKVRETLTAHREESESKGTLAPASVHAMRAAGLFRLKLPATLGGSEFDPLLQMEAIEEISRIHPSAGWCLMINSASIAIPGAMLPDSAVRQIFKGGQVPLASTCVAPKGQAIPTEGGYRLTGRWPFASGVRHAQWVNAGALVMEPGQPPQLRHFTMPASSIQIHDNWQVMGLRGTGSCDFSVNDLFVPNEFSFNLLADPPRRGGPLYRLGVPAIIANEHIGFALGVARLALDTATEMAQTKQRGFGPAAHTLARRGAFQGALGLADYKLRAARALAQEVYGKAWETIQKEPKLPPLQQEETRGAAAYATQVAVEVVDAMFSYGGGEANYHTSLLQHCLRDAHAAAQHIQVSNIAFENHGQFLLGLPEANPMG